MSFTLIPTSNAEFLAEKMKLPKGANLIRLEGNKDGRRIFPDGESYLRLPPKKLKKRVVVLHAGAPNPDQGVVELEMLLAALRDTGHKHIEIFFSYFPYGMQDGAKHPGETNSAKNLIEKLISYYKVKKIYVLDAHFHGKEWVRKYPVQNISALDLLKKAALKKYPNPIFMAPDLGSQRRHDLKGTTKKRKNSFEIDLSHDEHFIHMVKGQTVAVVDDIVETGGTAVKFAEVCKKVGVKKCIALITHGLLQSGIDRLKKNYSDVYVTNSISHVKKGIDISESVLKILENN
jgi:ribose-phosphate pyrophosphokinase